MPDKLKKNFKKAAKKQKDTSAYIPPAPVISVHDGVEDYSYLKLRGPLKKNWRHLSPEARAVVNHEITRVKSIRSAGDELAKSLDALRMILTLPWQKKPKKYVNIIAAQRKLDETHAGMDKVKEKCIELIAVMNSAGKSGGAICLDGPPGIGKTSIAYSLAAAMGRKCAKVSLSSVNDQGSITGHSRAYIGAGPGEIIKALQRAGTSNPIIILDEGDKAGSTRNGNPLFALLEALDPSQNKNFKDRFIDMPFDISDVLFVMTTNDLAFVPHALVDRMELIEMEGYTTEEKMLIAEKYSVPKIREQSGLKERQLKIKPEALLTLIEDYTKEAGVRQLEQMITDICRKTNLAIQKFEYSSKTIDVKDIHAIFGQPDPRPKVPTEDMVGITTGLYYSEHGGGILPIQVISREEGKPQLTITGNLGKVMQESASYAWEMIKNNAPRYGIDPQIIDKMHIHMHIPDAATPKNGPSAGIAEATAIISSLTGIKTRHDVAMTGEIDLYGNVLPIGGLKQKLDGARRAGAKTVLIPASSESELFKVPDTLKSALNIVKVKHLDEVLQWAMPDLKLNLAAQFSKVSNDNKPDVQNPAAAPVKGCGCACSTKNKNKGPQ